MQASPVNPMDQGIRSFAEANALGIAEAAQWVKISEVPFDFQRRRLSVVLRAANDTNENPVLICKVLNLGFLGRLLVRPSIVGGNATALSRGLCILSL